MEEILREILAKLNKLEEGQASIVTLLEEHSLMLRELFLKVSKINTGK